MKPKILKPNGKQRSGRGFSRMEIEKAGLNIAEARKTQLPIDNRRKTTHEENIEAIKATAKKTKTETKPKSKPEPKPQKKNKKEKSKK